MLNPVKRKRKFDVRKTYYWRRYHRLGILHRDKFRCVQCGSARNLQVDHIKRIADGGEKFNLDNLQTLCGDCHNRKTSAENRKFSCEGSEEWYNYRETAKDAVRN